MTKPLRFGVLVLSLLLVGVAVAQTTVVTVDQRQKFQSDDIGSGDRFGSSVSVDGSMALVGAPFEDTSGTDAGAVYVFELSGGSWSQTDKFQASDTDADDSFGSAVVLDGTTAFVGAAKQDTSGGDAGAVYVFELSGGSWSQTGQFFSTDIAANDRFGSSLAYDGTRLYVGAPLEDTSGANAGSVYVFELSGSSWSQTDKFQSDDIAAGDQFGSSLDVDDGRLLVGASVDGVGGSVYYYTVSGGAREFVEKFESNDVAANDGFGSAISVDGDLALVGAYLDDDSGSDSGSVYVFELSGDSWTQLDKFQSDDIAAGDNFGFDAFLGGSTAMVGAFGEGTGGSVYVFDFFVDTEPAPDPEPGGGAPFFGDDGALFGGDKSALADSLQVTETALDFIMGIMLTLIFAAGGFLLLGILGALMGAGFGFILSFAFGLFPLWVLIFILVLAAAFYYLRSNANG